MFGLSNLIPFGVEFAAEEAGATALEYSLLAALVAVAALAAFNRMGSSMNYMYNGVLGPLVTAALG